MRMDIWVLEIGEPLPLEKDVRLHRYGQFTRFLAERGHNVTWWTSSFSHAPKQHFAEKDQDVDYHGVTLRMIRGPGYGRNVSLARIRHNRHFAQRFKEMAVSARKPDIIISPIPIIEAAHEAVTFARENKIPIVTDIRDLWPDELRDRAPKPLRWLGRLMLTNAYRNMKFVCENVDGIMGVSQSYIDYGLKFAERERTRNDFLFPLGYSAKPVAEADVQKGLEWAAEIGLRDDHFVVAFFGTIGHFFDLETVIAAARILEKEFPIQFVLGGAGSELERYKKLAQDVRSVFFPGWLDAPKIAAVMRLAKVGLAPYRKDANMALPNKPFEYMAGKLPIVSSIQRELPELLREHRCGLTYRADSPHELAQALRQLNASESERAAMGERGHRLFQERFATEKIFADVMAHLEKVRCR